MPKDTIRMDGVTEYEYTLNPAIGSTSFLPVYTKHSHFIWLCYNIHACPSSFVFITADHRQFPAPSCILTQGTAFNQRVSKYKFDNQFDPTAPKQLYAGDT
jgi:hypothetical protein